MGLGFVDDWDSILNSAPYALKALSHQFLQGYMWMPQLSPLILAGSSSPGSAAVSFLVTEEVTFKLRWGTITIIPI